MKDFKVTYEVSRLLSDLPCPWAVAGGWAIDLFLNQVTRDHHDIEVAVFREDHLILQNYLSGRGWSFEYVRDGRFYPWMREERLVLPVHEIWCRHEFGPLQRLEVLLNERIADAFVYRRDSRIDAPIESTFIRSRSGIPILAPEIVLLYKSKRATEDKEQMDFNNMFEALDEKARHWLTESIAKTDPDNAWLTALRSPNETRETK